MDIPFQQLSPEALRAVIEEFVSRDGTDYGTREASHETKCAQVLELLRQNKIKLVFDAETESVDLREIASPRVPDQNV